MKNFLSKLQNIDSKKKAVYFSAFILICFFVALPVASAHAGLIDDFKAAIMKCVVPALKIIVFEVMKILLTLASYLVYLGAWLVDVMLNPAMYKAVLVGTVDTTTGLSTGAVQVGWRTVRDSCNMFYVFFLLLISFATIIGNQKYGYKSLLPKFVISIFLINFSAEITKMVIDVGQVFLFGMAAWLGSFSGAEGSGSTLSSIVDSFKAIALAKEGSAASAGDIVALIFAVLYSFVLGIIYIMLALFLLLRLVMFAVLIIISPFAFFSMVLPSMGKYTSQWWGLLFSNTVSGPVFIFFVYLSAVMAKELTDNPISMNASDLGDTSKMGGIEPFLMLIIPNVVAMGMLLFSVSAAKSVGAYGAGAIVGGRFGIGKVAGMSYALGKVGERATRRAGGGAARGVGWAKDVGVRNSSKAAGLQDWGHNKYQGVLGSIGKVKGLGGVTTGLSQSDAGAVEHAKKDAIDKRQKKYGDNLKSLDWKRLTQGDNIDKALALRAAAEQHDLGKPELVKHFAAAASVMPAGEIKDMARKNIAFSTMTPENQAKMNNKDRSSFTGLANDRITESIAGGMNEEEAIKHEIMVEAAKTSINKGKDKEAQGLDQADQSSAWADAYIDLGKTDRVSNKEDLDKEAFATGLKEAAATHEAKIQSAPATAQGKLREHQVNRAVVGIKTGMRVDAAIPVDDDNVKNQQIKKVYENKIMNAAVQGSMHIDDKEKYGHHATEDTLRALSKKNDGETMNAYKKAIKARKRDIGANPNMRISPNESAELDRKMVEIEAPLVNPNANANTNNNATP